MRRSENEERRKLEEESGGGVRTWEGGGRRETKVGWEKEERQWRGVGERGVDGGQGGGLREG